MSKFTDDAGREWSIVLDVGLIEDINEQVNVDLDEMIKNPRTMAETIFASPRKMVEILYVCCSNQIEAVPLTPREFARLFNRDVMDKASMALMEAIMLFYPRTSVGKVIRENLPMMISEMDRKMSNEAEKKMKEVLSDLRIDSPV